MKIVSRNRADRHEPWCRETAGSQLDFVFASTSLGASVSCRALRGVVDWGPSDHCRADTGAE